MRIGMIISSTAHGGLILLAMVWGIFEPAPPQEEMVVVSEVEILSDAEFQARNSVAPTIDAAQILAPDLPEELQQTATSSGEESLVDRAAADIVDDPGSADGAPDLTDILTVTAVESADAASTLAPPPPSDANIAYLQPRPVAPPLRRPQNPSLARPAPAAPALRIDTTPDTPPPPEVRQAEERQDALTEGEEETAPVEEVQIAQAPEESVTEIVPQIDEDQPAQSPVDESVDTPTEPEDPQPPEPEPIPVEPEIVEPETVEETPPQPEEVEPEAPETEELRVASAPRFSEPPKGRPSAPVSEIATADATDSTAGSAPQSFPLTIGEIDSFRAAIQQYWNVSILRGLPNAEDLVITLGAKLDQEGRVIGDVWLVAPRNLTPLQRRAFQSAQRAVMQASFRGAIQLPSEKYERWKEVEITFDPSKQQIGF